MIKYCFLKRTIPPKKNCQLLGCYRIKSKVLSLAIAILCDLILFCLNFIYFIPSLICAPVKQDCLLFPKSNSFFTFSSLILPECFSPLCSYIQILLTMQDLAQSPLLYERALHTQLKGNFFPIELLLLCLCVSLNIICSA